MATPASTSVRPQAPSPPEATVALQRIAKAWALDPFDAVALVEASARDLSAVTWTDDRLLRVAYLIELEKALIELDPKFGIPHWVVTPKPGPFFEGHAPLQIMTGSTRDLVELVRQVRRWKAGPANGARAPN